MSSTNLTRYKAVSALSARMLDAARANDWDHLSALEQEVATLMQVAKEEDATSHTHYMENESLRLEKVALIQQILADDREIRSYTEPWMESVRALLSEGSRKRAVNNMYGV
jgi:flagellar protein FliT